MLLNRDFFKDWIVQKDKWAAGDGVIEEITYLGTSILYYSFVHMLPAKVALVLGSGAGFIPRLVRQAQREVLEEKFLSSSRCILIDSNKDVNEFGRAEYFDNQSHIFQKTYQDIEILKMKTDESFQKLREEKVSIDFLHIDADHTYLQSLKDLENSLSLMSEDFVITLHDTAKNHLENKHDGCVPRTIARLRHEMESGGKYDHLEMINFNNRHFNPKHLFQNHLSCSETAVIKLKTQTVWDVMEPGEENV